MVLIGDNKQDIFCLYCMCHACDTLYYEVSQCVTCSKQKTKRSNFININFMFLDEHFLVFCLKSLVVVLLRKTSTSSNFPVYLLQYNVSPRELKAMQENKKKLNLGEFYQ